jgi:predicted dithiol-disulfide oxidoreductase (DUF899 family)
MSQPEIVSAEQWLKAREELLASEKELTRALDKLAARRRRLPMVELRHGVDYVFEGPTGKKTLLDLFEGNKQLAVYQFMDNGPDAFCPGCTFFTENVPLGALKILAANDISWATVSNMPLAQIEGYKQKRGWTLPFYSTHGTTFAEDCGSDGGFRLTMFLRDGEKAYMTYSTTARGVDRVLFANNIQDLAVYGRKEDWEDSPEGWPQFPTYG